MVQDSYIEFTEPVVNKLEGFADTLENIRYESDDWSVVVSLFLLYLESNLKESNIYDFVFKTDESKSVKLKLQEEKKILFDEINKNVKRLEESPNIVNEKWDQVREHYDTIKETEDTLNSSIEKHYENIKSIEEELQSKVQEEYDQIKKLETERNGIVDGEYFEIKSLESDIEDIHKNTSTISAENDDLYKKVEVIDHKLSEIENHIEDSEWKVELDSPEEKVFETIKNNLILNKRLKYGDI